MIHQRPSGFHARDREIALMPMAPDERPVIEVSAVLRGFAFAAVPSLGVWWVIVKGFGLIVGAM
jgi:hypothetical protein